ncbi:hypothetical protein K402DRAFT_239699 [Aulographum hederae CBS 113979]|uniref:Protection of telomeres protein 1 n=1 Tax=Aulographum hederae CBS 113979 TaxID=1176131 RepID=A0A6G1GKG1_9PEZI|nr:hypothetical protein K402DRAFT_239699 [Aulographum hederae CBS 113979]
MDSRSELGEPEGFLSLSDATNVAPGTKVSVIGVAIDYLPPKAIGGGKVSSTITLKDHTLPDGMKLKWFTRPGKHVLPPFKINDVVVVRKVETSDYYDKRCVIRKDDSAFIVFDDKMPEPSSLQDGWNLKHLASSTEGRPHQPPSHKEKLYAIKLNAWHVRNGVLKVYDGAGNADTAPASITPNPPLPRQNNVPGRAQKFSLLEKVIVDKFYDIDVEIMKAFPASDGTLSLYVTDYTSNSLFFNYKRSKEGNAAVEGYPDSGDWPGPGGTLTLQITLWEPHASYARDNLAPGCFAQLRNVRIKMSNSGQLEGTMWTDRQRPSQIDVKGLKETDWRVQAIVERKQAYDTSTKPKKESKKERKRREKMESEKAKKSANVSEHETENMNVVALSKPADLSGNIRSAYTDIPTIPLSAIWDNRHLHGKTPAGTERQLPFINMRCRANVRVVDFYPHNLQDFAQSLDDPTFNPPHSDDEDDSVSYERASGTPNRWQWAFCLLVEDAKPPAEEKDPVRLKLMVDDACGQYLLKLDAEDLRENPHLLGRLREKLFLLWGDLEEKKAAGILSTPSSMAFECCIQEYGVPTGSNDEWMRMHRLFGTTII